MKSGKRSRELHERALVIDGHSDMLNDVLPKRNLGRKNVIEEDWLPEMRKGGIDVRVAAVFNESEYVPELALRRGLDLVSVLLEEIEESEDLVLCTTCDDIRRAGENGRTGFILGMEGTEPLGMDLHLLRVFHALGLRILGLTHGLRNYAADPAQLTPAETGRAGGLSSFGVRLVEEADRLGVLIDLSHISDTGFWDVIDRAGQPVIASHSNARALLDRPRGLTDKQIKAVSGSGGVIGINACAVLVGRSEESTLEQLIAHLDHIVKAGGIECVGLGLDFADYLTKYFNPEAAARYPYMGPVQGLSGDAEVPKITEELLKRGYSDSDIELILGKNFLRVFEKVWK